MTIDELRQYKRILILGYGLEGKVSEKFIKLHHPDAHIGIADQKTDPHYLKQQKDYDLAIRTPLLRPEKITIPYTTGTNLFFANNTHRVIGVTGTKGKSTTVTLLQHILTASGRNSHLFGNIGTPMLDALMQPLQQDDLIVLELSNYQLEDCHYSPHIACFLNIYHELHNHASYEEYSSAKHNIALHQSKEDTFFYNGDFSEIAALANRTAAHAVDFTTYELPDLGSFDVQTSRDNLKAVFSMLTLMGLNADEIVNGLTSFELPPHRMNIIGVFSGITFIDDSAANHPEATVLALNTLDDVDTVLLGGQDRDYDFSHVMHVLAEKQVSNLILFPETEEKIYNEYAKLDSYEPQIFRVTSMDEAVRFAYKHTQPGKTCLLSPGAPSYLMYKDFFERGEHFENCVKLHATQTQTQNSH